MAVVTTERCLYKQRGWAPKHERRSKWDPGCQRVCAVLSACGRNLGTEYLGASQSSETWRLPVLTALSTGTPEEARCATTPHTRSGRLSCQFRIMFEFRAPSIINQQSSINNHQSTIINQQSINQSTINNQIGRDLESKGTNVLSSM